MKAHEDRYHDSNSSPNHPWFQEPTSIDLGCGFVPRFSLSSLFRGKRQSRLQFLSAWVFSSLTLLGIGQLALAAADEPQPNFLIFMADDMTYRDLGCYGNPDVRTPHVDRLAAEGIRFMRCYNSAPTCSPLRQSLYTGIYPVRNGAHPNHSRVYPEVNSLPHYLRKLGYRVGIVGKRHEAPAEAFPFEMLGGRHHDGGKSPPGSDLPITKGVDFIQRDPEQPWCLVVTSNQPHSPWNRGDASEYTPAELELPAYLLDTAETREALSHYYAEITYMDQQFGRVMQAVRSQADASNTLVLWLSEQGASFPFGKWTCYDMGIHASAIVWWPAQIASGERSDALISYVDVVPTLIELAGGKPKELDLDGESFARVLRGQTDQHHQYVFATHTTRGIFFGSEAYASRAVTDGRWLYIRNLHSEYLFKNIVTERSKIFASWKALEDDFAQLRTQLYQKRPHVELFNLQQDPFCMRNLSESPDYSQPRRRLATELDRWMQRQGDQGDITEMSAESRQPDFRPWAHPDGYALTESE